MAISNTKKDSNKTNDRLFTSNVYLENKDGMFKLYCNHPLHILHTRGRPRKIFLKTFNEKNCLNCEHLYKELVV